jgi:hypothetical protein
MKPFQCELPPVFFTEPKMRAPLRRTTVFGFRL